jgi:NADH:ubiquinone oxidoreductase subunit 5 (subunit L)/multisubunit Na+/H+ antiporter MnhA subunit
MFLVGATAICGLPPLNGFVSEWVIYSSLFAGVFRGVGASGAAPALGLVSLALMGGLALACFAKVFGVVFLGQPRDAIVSAHPTPVRMKIAMGGLAIGCMLIGIFPGQWLPLVQSATSELVRSMPPAEVELAIRSIPAPAAELSKPIAVFVLVVIGLVLIRRRVRAWATALHRTASRVVATWSCAYAEPTARMQYTASSFASSLIVSFRALLWPHRELVSPAGTFPVASHLETHAPDIAERELFEPLFGGLARLFAMVRTLSLGGESGAKPDIAAESGHPGPVRTLLLGLVSALRSGSIQVRLAFIVVTLVLLLVFEAISSPTAVNSPASHKSVDTAATEVKP